MIRPGKYRAVTETTVEHCRSNGGFNAPSVAEYVTYEAGEVFEIPRSVNGFYYRVMENPETREPMGKYESAEDNP